MGAAETEAGRANRDEDETTKAEVEAALDADAEAKEAVDGSLPADSTPVWTPPYNGMVAPSVAAKVGVLPPTTSGGRAASTPAAVEAIIGAALASLSPDIGKDETGSWLVPKKRDLPEWDLDTCGVGG